MMNIKVVPPHVPETEWEAAASIAVVIGRNLYELYVAARAAKTFKNAPGGIEGLISLTEQVESAWRQYANSLIPENYGDDEDESK